ncbi:hypothetical protein I4U23_017073 [Adineta vaga]|nr:hypothetical protein I4U23_017073 [Adineta vaga]
MVQQQLSNINENTNTNTNTISNDNDVNEYIDAETSTMSNANSSLPSLSEKGKQNRTVESSKMLSDSSITNLTEEVLSFHGDEFYNLVEEQYGNVAIEIMEAQDISSVECFLEINNIFIFLELDSDDLISLKKKAGIYLISDDIFGKFPFIRIIITYSKLIMTNKIDFTILNIILKTIFNNLISGERGYRYDNTIRQFAASVYILGGRTTYDFLRLNIPALLPSVQIIQLYIASSKNHLM